MQYYLTPRTAAISQKSSGSRKCVDGPITRTWGSKNRSSLFVFSFSDYSYSTPGNFSLLLTIRFRGGAVRRDGSANLVYEVSSEAFSETWPNKRNPNEPGNFTVTA